MPRAEIPLEVTDQRGRPLTGASVTCVSRADASVPTVYSSEGGVGELTWPLETTHGRLDGWMEFGRYRFTASYNGHTRDYDLDVVPAEYVEGIIGGEIDTSLFALDAALQAHINDNSDAHDAVAVSFPGVAVGMAATTVHGAIVELLADIGGAADASEPIAAAHIADTVDAHDASAISYPPGNGIDSTDVGGAIDEAMSMANVANTNALAVSNNLSAAGKGYVNHGAVAGTARPTGFASVEWVGSVEPTNWIDGDTWIDTSA